MYNKGSSSTKGSVGVCTTTGGRPVQQGQSDCVKQGFVQYTRGSKDDLFNTPLLFFLDAPYITDVKRELFRLTYYYQ